VLVNPIWQRFALLLNLLGTIVLFYSFQATSSDFRLVTATYDPTKRYLLPPATLVAGGGHAPPGTKQYALCVNDYTLMASDAASGIRLGFRGCPSWENAKPAAVVNIEHPRFVGLGFVMILAGFLLQYFAVPKPATIVYLRDQLRKAKKEEQLKREAAKNTPKRKS
jgi:hypothetical protein